MRHVGFTGTQRGMTEPQGLFVERYLGVAKARPLAFHHGDCVGADAQAHMIAQALGIPVVLHPPSNDSKRAFCAAAEELPPLPYLQRNHAIVDASQVMLATPGEAEEQLRSGTWATIRYSKRRGVTLYVVLPGGNWKRFP